MVLVHDFGRCLAQAIQNNFYQSQTKEHYSELTLDRISNLNASLINFKNPIIVTNENHRFIVAEQLCQQK